MQIDRCSAGACWKRPECTCRQNYRPYTSSAEHHRVWCRAGSTSNGKGGRGSFVIPQKPCELHAGAKGSHCASPGAIAASNALSANSRLTTLDGAFFCFETDRKALHNATGRMRRAVRIPPRVT
jgi:hypothetical protein